MSIKTRVWTSFITRRRLLRVYSLEASTRHVCVYPPLWRLPAAFASTRHVGVYSPQSRPLATGASTRNSGVCFPAACAPQWRLPATVHTHHARGSVPRRCDSYRPDTSSRDDLEPQGPPVPTEPHSAFHRSAVGVRTSTKHLAEAKEFTSRYGTRVQSPTHIYSRRLETSQ